MTAQSKQITGEDLRFAEGQMKLFQIFHRVLEKHFADLGNPDMVDPLSGQSFNASIILKGIALHRDELERDFADMKDTLKLSSEPPSLGTVVRSLREKGIIDLSDVQPEDFLLTQRLSPFIGQEGDAAAAGEKAALAGLLPEENPYDLMDDRQAISHLSWSDGYSAVTPKSGSTPTPLIPIPQADVDEMIKIIVGHQMERMSKQLDDEDQVLVIKRFITGRGPAGGYALCQFAPTATPGILGTVPYRYNEIGPIPNTVIQVMGSRGFLSEWDAPNGRDRTWSLSLKALQVIGPQLGYSVLLPEDDGPAPGI